MRDISRELAASLLDIGAVLLRPSSPFTWASGWLSPIYCDNRRILSHPDLRDFVASSLAEAASCLFPDFDVVGGVATGAIAHGVLVAERLGKPFVYVRPKPKDHGTGSQIEGELPSGSRVVVIEDLVSTGKSSLEAVSALRSAGADVLGMVAIFTYGFDKARLSFEEAGVPLHTLSNYTALIQQATESGYIPEDDFGTISRWRANPSEWGK